MCWKAAAFDVIKNISILHAADFPSSASNGMSLPNPIEEVSTGDIPPKIVSTNEPGATCNVLTPLRLMRFRARETVYS